VVGAILVRLVHIQGHAAVPAFGRLESIVGHLQKGDIPGDCRTIGERNWQRSRSSNDSNDRSTTRSGGRHRKVLLIDRSTAARRWAARVTRFSEGRSSLRIVCKLLPVEKVLVSFF
jgi:hypothetical protein